MLSVFLASIEHTLKHTHTHTLPFMQHSLSACLSVKTWALFTFPPGGNWQKKEQAFLDRSDTSSADSATQTTTYPAREGNDTAENCSQKTWVNFFRGVKEAQESHQFPHLKTLDGGDWRYFSFNLCVWCERKGESMRTERSLRLHVYMLCLFIL